MRGSARSFENQGIREIWGDLLTALLVFVTSILLLLSLGAKSARAETSTPLRIGVILGLTGAGQLWADQARMGLELAKDDLEKEDGIKLELVYEDSKSTPAGSVTAFQKLVNVEHVTAVIGEQWSITTNPIIPLAERAKVVLMSPTVMDLSVEKESPYFFSMGQKIEGLRKPAEKFLALHPQLKTVSMICWDDNWGNAHEKLWKSIFEARGIKILDEICDSDYTSDYRVNTQRALKSSPDFLSISYPIEVVARRMSEAGNKTLAFGNNLMLEALEFRNPIPGSMDGWYFSDFDGGPAFRSKFEARYGKEPVIEPHNSYEALRSVARAAAKNRSDVRAALKELSYEGVAGPVDFTKSNFGNQSGAVLKRIENSQAILVP